jgi:hypothetical protein
MFRIHFLSSFLFLFATAMSALLGHWPVRPHDLIAYKKLMRESAELKTKQVLESQPAHQSRHRVQKDIWIPKDAQRIHWQMQSVRSELEIFQKKDKLEAVEHLESLNCWAQDGQQIRTLKAETGVSYFPSYRFGAENVQVDFFQLPDSEMSASIEGCTPFLTGTADTAKFMEELSLEGHVRLVSNPLNQIGAHKKSFAVSDRLVYHPQTQSIVLSCDQPHRVLFWQDGLSLSASAVNIQRDPKTGVDRIEGEGDVRCCLNSEEKDFLERLFSKYL